MDETVRDALIEPSFAEAIAAIEGAPGLPQLQGRQWTCSLRQIARALDRPLELVPARWTALRVPVDRLHHAQLGMTAKTLANHRSNTKAALRWFQGDTGGPVRGALLTADWSRLRDGISDRGVAARLYGLMRYCSAKGIAPGQIGDEVVQNYLAYRVSTTSLAGGVAAHRSIARSWNGCVGLVDYWPTRWLHEPTLPSKENGPPWDAFPEGLRTDVAVYVAGLAQVRRAGNGKRLRPSKPSTIRTRLAEIKAFARKAVQIGIPLEQLGSLGSLLDPDTVEKVVDAYWTGDGEVPKTYTIDLASKVLSIARLSKCLDDSSLEQLEEMRFELEAHRQGGMTDLNLAVIRQVLSGRNWAEVVALPWRLMAEARSLREHAPVKAALRAQLAVAIGIVTVAPVRPGNLVRIRLEDNLVRPTGPYDPFWLRFPEYDVKNRIKLEFPFDEELTTLIEEYLFKHRVVLLRGSNESWLFPGERGRFKTQSMFSKQITDAVAGATGLRIRAHQFRHAAAALILKRDPGNYEFVRRVLGHKTVQTTINFYIGLETAQATTRFGEIVRKELTFSEERA